MTFENMHIDLSLLYNRAKKKFEACINSGDNKFLQDEVSIPLNNIIIIEKNIKIVFSKRVFEQYLIEVSLMLFEGDKEIGKYIYIESDKSEAIDDSLVFY